MEATVRKILARRGFIPSRSQTIGPHTFEARQFPKSSGYPEDAATGVAAAALAFGLLAAGRVAKTDQIRVLQGRAMGRPSAIAVRFQLDRESLVTGCWLGGAVQLAD